MAQLLRNKDFLSGILFIGAGATFLYIGHDYALGTTRRMGPGYFPTLLSITLILIGAGITLNAFRSQDYVADFSLRGLAAVTIGTVAFGLLIRDAGILIAVAALVLIAALGNPRSKWLPISALAAGMAAFCYLIFVKALGLPIPVLGSWFTS